MLSVHVTVTLYNACSVRGSVHLKTFLYKKALQYNAVNLI